MNAVTQHRPPSVTGRGPGGHGGYGRDDRSGLGGRGAASYTHLTPPTTDSA